MQTPRMALGQASRAIGALPGLFRVGLVVFALGGAGDLAYHLLSPSVAESLEGLLGPDAMRAHLVTLAGMVIIFGSILHRGLRHGH